ncbi:HTH domain-containing protein [Candidatus Gottesmanbacteria bacterium]|nr:HTH domain-containing protein [Candidatus Gottesmanbacteria bacterium]MBI5452715.1 HTH domain-containing protein [Candidatus Gottesmanbacteria bacterium]
MRTLTSQNIIKYISLQKQASAKELADYIGISRQALYKHLPKLLEDKKIAKRGRPPMVFYFIPQIKTYTQTVSFKGDIAINSSSLIEKNYLLITPSGERLEGIKGFSYWCDKNNLPFEKTVKEYEKTFQKYSLYKKGNFIDGGYKLRNTFPQVFLDKIYYLDFYSIERFGKTKLGWLLLYAKQSQNKKLIAELTAAIKDKVRKIIGKYRINAVGFIPPTVKRQIQLMTELERNLRLPLPIINLRKIKTEIIVPQKTLSRLEERIENARETIFLADSHIYENVLLIDDAVGSGATLNETARKLKERKIAGKVFGLAITGSFKGFEIISEV